MTVLTLKDVSFSYKNHSKKVLDHINAQFEEGKIYMIVGESGSGKTSLLSLIAGLSSCTEGLIQYKDKNISKMNKDDYRSKEIGIIFQSYNLLLTDTAVENVELSIHLSGCKLDNIRERAYALLNKVGIDQEKADRKILKLSGGEQQRVAIARSLSFDPNLIIADEPTGNLDSHNEIGIMEIFKKLAHKERKCVIVVTHSTSIQSFADVVLRLEDSKLIKVSG